jgi:hypothetical protein
MEMGEAGAVYWSEMRSRGDLRRRAGILFLANDADRGKPLCENAGRMVSMNATRFGSDRPTFPQVRNETVGELGMVVAAVHG